MINSKKLEYEYGLARHPIENKIVLLEKIKHKNNNSIVDYQEKKEHTYSWKKLFNSALITTIYLLGTTTRKSGTNLAKVANIGGGLLTTWTGFSIIGKAGAGSVNINMQPDMPINVSLDLTQLAENSDISNLMIKYPQKLVQGGLKLYTKLLSNYATGQTTAIFQLLASNVNKVTGIFSDGIQLFNEAVLISSLFTDGTLQWKHQTIPNLAESMSYSLLSPAIANDATIYVASYSYNNRNNLYTSSIYAINADGILSYFLGFILKLRMLLKLVRFVRGQIESFCINHRSVLKTIDPINSGRVR